MELFTRREVLTVSELLGRLKRQIEERFDFVWVEGEISGLRQPGSGHYYFSLKDDEASLRAVFFRQRAGLLRFRLEDGQKVLCSGRMSVYAPRGDVQLVVDAVEPRGAGELALAFEQIKRRLLAEGLFDAERKRPLPTLIQRVAVVTSKSGAAVRDFLHVLHKRYERMAVAIYPVAVQGIEAPPQMIAALKNLAEWGWPQVIVLTRGGGSPEDLWAFNDETLARAIADCPIPVVSAVGHEVDVSISDLVADVRAPTPTAAAELLARPMAEADDALHTLSGRLAGWGPRAIRVRRAELKGLKRGLIDPRRRLTDLRLRVDDLLIRAAQALKGSLHRDSRRLWGLQRDLRASRPEVRLLALAARRAELQRRLAGSLETALTGRRASLSALNGRLRALGPQAVLERGYALVTDAESKVLRRAEDTRPGDALKVRLAQGELAARVEEVLP